MRITLFSPAFHLYGYFIDLMCVLMGFSQAKKTQKLYFIIIIENNVLQFLQLSLHWWICLRILYLMINIKLFQILWPHESKPEALDISVINFYFIIAVNCIHILNNEFFSSSKESQAICTNNRYSIFHLLFFDKLPISFSHIVIFLSLSTTLEGGSLHIADRTTLRLTKEGKN